MVIKTAKKSLALLLTGAALLTTLPSLANAGDYVLIVNAKNNSSADASEVKQIFLKKKTKWSDGSEAKPFSRAKDSAEEKAFFAKILGMTEAQADEYWGKEKSKSGTTRPRSVSSDSVLLRQVGRKDGGVGVISADTELTSKVKVLLKFSD